jgi:hypothetical protein
MLEDVGIKEIYYSKDIKGYGYEVIKWDFVRYI